MRPASGIDLFQHFSGSAGTEAPRIPAVDPATSGPEATLPPGRGLRVAMGCTYSPDGTPQVTLKVPFMPPS